MQDGMAESPEGDTGGKLHSCQDADMPAAPQLVENNSDFSVPSALRSMEEAGRGYGLAAVAENGKLKASSLMALDTGYSYQQFVERFKHPSAQVVVDELRDFVNQFPANLTRPQAARRIHTFLSEVTPRLLAVEAFSSPDLADTGQELAGEGLEKFVVLKLYKLLFRHAPADLREDERVEAAISSGRSAGARGPHAALLAAMAQLEQKHREVFSSASVELQKVDQYRAPRDKLNSFVNAFQFLEGIVVERVYTSKATNDPSYRQTLLQALIMEAAPPNLFSNIEFAAAFRHPSRRKRDQQNCLAEFASALSCVVGGGLRFSIDVLDRGERLAAPLGIAEQTTAVEDLPPWLIDAGITFHFENKSPDELLVGEVDELLDEYHRMARALQELVLQSDS
eukprot:TRINITY_DN92247_c0_g1_i1.p1 TRINITY_DN92247_c0_g1~~TRINITY_DN92247_c0_g1_i1.p1  ORF type:complete len:396 (-),score=89.39 TRINITY_DN92247_c0_g1_i1:34-1221(-)